MIYQGFYRIFSAATALLVVFVPKNLYACAVCFGASDSTSLIALRISILTLLGIVLAVLGGIIAFFIQMQKRAKKVIQAH